MQRVKCGWGSFLWPCLLGCVTSAHWKPVAVPIALKLTFAWCCFELILTLVIVVPGGSSLKLAVTPRFALIVTALRPRPGSTQPPANRSWRTIEPASDPTMPLAPSGQGERLADHLCAVRVRPSVLY